MNMYETALKNKLRFKSEIGQLSIEHLFELPISNRPGLVSLNQIARDISTILQNGESNKFVDEHDYSDDKLRLSIIERIIDIKTIDRKLDIAKKKRLYEIERIKDVIEYKKREKLSSVSIKKLEKMVQDLQE